MEMLCYWSKIDSIATLRARLALTTAGRLGTVMFIDSTRTMMG